MSDNIRFLGRNYAQTDFLNAYTATSEDADFPLTNAFNLNRRTKVWRSAGYWEITTSNNKIVFQEASGVNLTATVTVGNYASSTLFFAAIKTALEAAGVANYTVAFSTTTGQVKITSDVSGGATIFSLIWTHVNSSGMAATLGFSDAVDDTGAANYTADLLKINTSEVITFDFGMSSNPQAFALFFPTNAPNKLSPDATLTLQGNGTDVWSSPAYSQALTYKEGAMSLTDVDGLHTDALRYWRLKMVDQSNVNGYLEIGGIYIGEIIQPTQGAVQFPFQEEFVDLTRSITAESGAVFADLRQKTKDTSIEIVGLTKSEKEELDDLFKQFGVGNAFPISFDPGAVFGSSEDYHMTLLRFKKEPGFDLIAPNLFNSRMDFREDL